MRNKFRKSNRKNRRWPVICGNRLYPQSVVEAIENIISDASFQNIGLRESPPLAQGSSKLTLRTVKKRRNQSPPPAQKLSHSMLRKVIRTTQGIKVVLSNGKIVEVKPVN